MRASEAARRDPLLASALALAFALFARTFRGPRTKFWRRMTQTGAVLGTLALASEPELRKLQPKRSDLAAGLGSAAGLYVIFRVGDFFARRIMPKGAEDIDAVYELRSGHDPKALAARFATVIGPAEELFWRGFVQRRLEAAHGGTGTVAAIAAYGGVHLVTGNATLVGAATVAGAYWGLLAAAGMRMEALIVSHVAWDVVIFLVAPTQHD